MPEPPSGLLALRRLIDYAATEALSLSNDVLAKILEAALAEADRTIAGVSHRNPSRSGR